MATRRRRARLERKAQHGGKKRGGKERITERTTDKKEGKHRGKTERKRRDKPPSSIPPWINTRRDVPPAAIFTTECDAKGIGTFDKQNEG